MKLTLSIIKPDAVKRNLTGKINTMIENKSIKIIGQKMIKLSLEDARNTNRIEQRLGDRFARLHRVRH